MSEKNPFHKLEFSAVLTLFGVILLFSTSVAVTLIAPRFIDPSWNQTSCGYQEQMYEYADPNVYVSTANLGAGFGLQYVYHVKEGATLLSFQETEIVKILAPPDLEPYVTRLGDQMLKLTTKVLLLQKHPDEKKVQAKYQEEWKQEHADWQTTGVPHFEIFEMHDPSKQEAFVVTETDGVIENWKGSNFEILGHKPPFYTEGGVIYVRNPKEYKIEEINYFGTLSWRYNEQGHPIQDLNELKEGKMRFLSRESLIRLGEDIYRIEGCWYCHTDQTRTLVQDVVLNGSESYPAPPSSANEYVYQRVTFPGTRRIGPDLSRVGIKRASRDWHLSHFWSPKTESRGSIMPSFKHFFDNDPSGTPKNPYGVPNYQFEAIYQYLMTKGTRITSPDQAWWLGKDPIQTMDIVEGRK